MKRNKTYGKLLKTMIATMLLGACAAGFSGCAGKEAAKEDSERTVVTMMYVNALPEFEALVENTFPDIDLQVQSNISTTINRASVRKLTHGHGTDIVTIALPSEEAGQYLLDLSTESYVSNYQSTVMNTYLENGRIKYIPLPGQYMGFIYNKTLAEKAGITEIETQEELLAMLDSAHGQGIGMEEDGSMFGIYTMDIYAIASYFYGVQVPDFLALPEGIIWDGEMQEGEGNFVGSMEDCVAFAMQLIERGYMNPDRILSKLNNATPVLEDMQSGNLMMAYGNARLYNTLENSNSEYEYAMLPFLSKDGNHSWTLCIPDGFLALNAALGEAGNEAKLEACHRILGLLSTPEGQKAFMADNGAARSYLLGDTQKENIVPEGIRKCVEEGYVYKVWLPMDVLQYFGAQMVTVLTGEAGLKDALQAVDDYFYHGSVDSNSDIAVIGTLEEDLIYENYNVRLRETALGNLVADAVREAAMAEMAFANGGSIRESLYEGDVLNLDMDIVCPYGNRIVVLEVDADTIWSMLENGISTMYQETNIPGGRFLNVSGLCYSFTEPDEEHPARLLSVTLPDGRELSKEATYTIAVTDYMAGHSGYYNNGDDYTMLNIYSDTVPLAEKVRLMRETGLTYADAMRLYFQNHKDIVTAQIEGRITSVDRSE
ncbi:MAG: extracellular solute-binding protein [Acetatifactor sp.]|nr:extracellular solute-binding protein [Acetatifactor sp.]